MFIEYVQNAEHCIRSSDEDKVYKLVREEMHDWLFHRV